MRPPSLKYGPEDDDTEHKGSVRTPTVRNDLLNSLHARTPQGQQRKRRTSTMIEDLRGGADMLPAVRTHTGCTALPANNSFVKVGDRQLVWLGPDEFLLLCEAGSEAHLHSQLMLDLGSVHAAATNVTDSLCALSLRGPAVRQVLAKGCALDLHPAAFAPGMCAQSMLSHAAVTLMANEDNRFTVICRTSFAPYLHNWLLDAGMEYGVSFRG